MTVINPFDFFVEESAENYPFKYSEQLARELAPFREVEPAGPMLSEWLASAKADLLAHGPTNTVNLLVALNQRLARDIQYIVRMEPGVYRPEETLGLHQGSCRDSGWLFVHILRHLGIAARFVSGYLIQLTADVKALDGPSGTDHDFTDLHAWAEAYLPGAGWIGFDATSGLMAGEGHIPLACTAVPASAAAIFGFTDVSESTFDVEMTVTRIHEDPRVTKPYTEEQWSDIEALGQQVESELSQGDVRLTMGGEPTFVSVDDMDGLEWNYAALGEDKRKLAGNLLQRLQKRFAPGGLLHYGQGKWYPGEPLPRWALTCLWRVDGFPLWRDAKLLAEDGRDYGSKSSDAQAFIRVLAARLGLHRDYVVPAYEDVWDLLRKEQDVPVNYDPLERNLADPAERSRLARLLQGDVGIPAGYVLPLAASEPSAGGRRWRSSRWPVRREHLYLVPGDSPMGLRLPLDSLPKVAPADQALPSPPDPFDAQPPLEAVAALATEFGEPQPPTEPAIRVGENAREIVLTALCVQAREGRVHVFLPPVATIEDFISLVHAVEEAARETQLPVVVEGYLPAPDPRVKRFAVTPDPGVIEVNIHPAFNWQELVDNTRALYEEARLTRLATEKFMLDGRHTGTGGGNHVTVGGPTPADSPLLRRPDLLRSLIAYWQNHPALSYLFSGMFIGPTSQAPRVDEARDDTLYELDIAFQEMDKQNKTGAETLRPWLVDRLLRNLLVDLTGNTHRAEFSIDKLYSPDSSTGRLGLLEFRAFEMPPHYQMSCVQMLLLRSLIARFWRQPYPGRVIPWGNYLHDRFMLPHFVAEDLLDVVLDLQRAGYPVRFEWFAPFVEFRFPRYGTVVYNGIEIELRQALEPWHVMGEEVRAGATSRYVDSSVERIQVKVRQLMNRRYAVTCNGRPLPLAPTGTHGEYVAGVRYRAWQPPSALHPTIPVHSPLVFDLVDMSSGRSLGGCTYHVVHPGGRSYERFPVNANEAEARRMARFTPYGHTPGPMQLESERPSAEFPLTLDLRRAPDREGTLAPSVPHPGTQQQ
ncbi:MAG TPA: transglutaminase family protein, partial [Burkholderiales bacterium]|nr:transglutaminase family protein [Burkholderiales bacterium]